MTTLQRNQRRPGALVGHGRQPDAQRPAQHHRAQMGYGPRADVGKIDFLLVGFEVGEQFFRVLRRQVLARNQRHRHVHDQAHVFEAGQRVVTQLAKKGRSRRHAVVVDQEGIAVRFRRSDELRAARAAGTGPGFHDDSLAERARHRRRQDARQDIGRSAGRERHNQRDGALGIVRKRRAAVRRQQAGADAKQVVFQPSTHDTDTSSVTDGVAGRIIARTTGGLSSVAHPFHLLFFGEALAAGLTRGISLSFSRRNTKLDLLWRMPGMRYSFSRSRRS